jgi:hypothetical protein
VGREAKVMSQTADMYVPEESDGGVVCAEQRTDQEGSSPSGAQMRSAVSESGGNASLAGASGRYGEPYTARRRKPETAKGDLKPPLGKAPEGRVSTVRWNSKA